MAGVCGPVRPQTAASVVGHMSLGVAGLGCEAALTHLLNYVWPNIFEVSPHVVQVRRAHGARTGTRPGGRLEGEGGGVGAHGARVGGVWLRGVRPHTPVAPHPSAP